MRNLHKIFKNLIPRLTSVLLLLIVLFSVLRPISVSAQAATGVGGFTGCDFSSIEKDPTGGSKLFEGCIRQVITFLFVVGLFLIVFRIGLSAFNSINPGADGNAIKDSVGAVRDIMIGLLLIIAPSIILATVNPAALSLNFLDLGKLASNIGGTNSATKSTGDSNNTTKNTTGGTNNSGTTTSTTTTTGTKDAAGNILPDQIKSASDLDSALKFYKANPTNAEAKKVLKSYLSKQQQCSGIFIEVSRAEECKDINKNYTTVLDETIKVVGSNPPLEELTNFKGIIQSTVNLETLSSLKDGDGQIVVVKYTPTANPVGVPLPIISTMKISGCDIDQKLITPGNILTFNNNITTSNSCNLKIVSSRPA
jgi:hypothetical protein